MSSKNFYNKLTKNIHFVTVSVTLLTFLFLYTFSSFLWTLNKDFANYLTSATNNKYKNDNIIVVEIDDRTFNRLGFPLSREDYIPFLDYLKSLWVSTIGFDIFFADKWKDETVDNKFASKIDELWNVIIGYDIEENIKLIQPYEKFWDVAKDIWYFSPLVDWNWKVYSIEPFREFPKYWFKYSFSISVLKHYLWLSDNELIISDTNLETPYQSLPLIKKNINNRDLLVYDTLYKDKSNFHTVSFFDIYNHDISNYNFKDWVSNELFFKDKIILVWATAEGTKDEFTLPHYGIQPGVFIHANVLSNLLDNKHIKYFNLLVEKLLIFLLIYCLIYLFTFKIKNNLSIFLSFLIITVVVLLLYLVLLYIFKFTGIFYTPNEPYALLLVTPISILLSYIIKFFITDRSKDTVVKALWEYVSPEIVNEILHWDWNVNLSWERKRISIFFSDIAWFTTISEKLSPEELVWFLREYLWKMSNIIVDNRWFINKYEWDAIMALWWVFTEKWKQDTFDICNSALIQQTSLKELNDRWKNEWHDTFSVRMWIHTWEAIVWNIWAAWKKMEFTALWDAVNLWSRLEWVNKFYWTSICVSEITKNEVDEYFIFRYLDKIRVKWKNLPVKIYELVWRKGEVSSDKLSMIKEFELWLDFYFNKDFSSAKKIFDKLWSLGDKTSAIFSKRCDDLSVKYEVEIPREDWDWVWEMTEK